MAFCLKIVSVRSSCSPRAPRRDKPPKDCLQGGGRDDLIVGKGHSDEIVGVEYWPGDSFLARILLYPRLLSLLGRKNLERGFLETLRNLPCPIGGNYQLLNLNQKSNLRNPWLGGR